MAGITNLTIEKGANFDVTITLTDAAGSPLDLTQYTASGKMRMSLISTEQVFDFQCSVPAPATAGNIRLQQSNAYTSTIPVGRYLYTIEIYDLANNILKRVLEGIVFVTPSASIYEGATGFVGATGWTYDGINFNVGATSFLRLH